MHYSKESSQLRKEEARDSCHWWRDRLEFLQFLPVSAGVSLVQVLAWWVRPPQIICAIFLHQALLILDIRHYRRRQFDNRCQQGDSGRCFWERYRVVLPDAFTAALAQCTNSELWRLIRRAYRLGTLYFGAVLLVLNLVQLNGSTVGNAVLTSRITTMIALLCGLHAVLLALVCGVMLLNRFVHAIRGHS